MTGVDDDLADDDIIYNVVGTPSSAQDAFNNLSPVESSVTNVNDDPPGVRIDPVGGLVTTEAGGTTTFSAVLLSGPSADVSFDLSTSNSNEGTVSVSSLTFTSGNWAMPQTVTITGVDDKVDDGDITYNIVTSNSNSTDAAYNDLNVSDVDVVNSDDDSTGFSLSTVSGLTTSEAGGSSTFTVALLSEPTAGITVSLTSSEDTEGSSSPASIVFTDNNWNTAQTVTVTGVNDDVDDDEIDYNINVSASSNDPTYSVLYDASVSVTNTDDDVAGYTVSGNSGLVTTEAGGDATVTIVLHSEPTADVFIVLTSADATEGLPYADSLRFTADTWDTPQDIRLIGQNDYVDE